MKSKISSLTKAWMWVIFGVSWLGFIFVGSLNKLAGAVFLISGLTLGIYLMTRYLRKRLEVKDAPPQDLPK